MLYYAEAFGERTLNSSVSRVLTQCLAFNLQPTALTEIKYTANGLEWNVLPWILYTTQYGSDRTIISQDIKYTICQSQDCSGSGLVWMPPPPLLMDTGEKVNNLQEILNEKENPSTRNRIHGLLITLHWSKTGLSTQLISWDTVSIFHSHIKERLHHASAWLLWSRVNDHALPQHQHKGDICQETVLFETGWKYWVLFLTSKPLYELCAYAEPAILRICWGQQSINYVVQLVFHTFKYK